MTSSSSTLLKLKEGVIDYLWSWRLSKRGRLGLAVLTAGVSLSILAGLILRQRRRRYRPVAPKRSTLYRSNTFQETAKPPEQLQQPVAASPLTVTEEESPPLQALQCLDETDAASVSSDDSFHSTVDVLDQSISPHALYLTALEVVANGQVTVRKNRAVMLQCSSDIDFLAKVYCVRLAFDHVIQSPEHRSYFIGIAQSLMSEFLTSAGEDSKKFCEQFDGLVSFMTEETSWNTAVEELTARKVGAMNVYDIGVDFILLDAFDDLESPPSAFLSVLKNRWITTGMKRSALSAALWSILKAKKGMLKHKNGFMSRFYAVSEVLTPAMAWGFLGTDESLRTTCCHFKEVVLHFVRSVFSLETVRYSRVEFLSQDLMTLAQQAAEDMRIFSAQHQQSS